MVARGRRHLDQQGTDCVERGYLLIPVWLQQLGRGDFEGGYRTACEAADIGDRFGDADLSWLARDDQARALVGQGRIEEGLRLVDEILVVATSGELSPVVTGIVYCTTIAFCRDVYELRHAWEWTDVLRRWCEAQPEMVAHNGLCLVHRAESMLLRGEPDAALAEAREAAERYSKGILNQIACGTAHYCQGAAHRHRGDFASAEVAHRGAGNLGCDPQPGLALLRLAQGNGDAAAAAIRRAVGETTDPLRRAGMLPAYVQIMIAAGNMEMARAGCAELEGVSRARRSDVLSAMAGYSRGALALAEGRRARRCRSCELRWASGTNSEPRTRRRASGSSSASPAGRWVTRTLPRSRSWPPEPRLRGWVRSLTRRRPPRSSSPVRVGTPTG